MLTGLQAVARAPLDQRRRDRAAGRNTAAYVSGYPGSPLAGLDLELHRRRRLLEQEGVVHQPGLNEELAATAVQGTQLIDAVEATVEGVTGYWYGKAPG
ncbi:MAG TPA: hypothetical protein VHO06_15015, partial [Polyangia bacterium]|nr:hypothetical protein [Polyangia bacterium]